MAESQIVPFLKRKRSGIDINESISVRTRSKKVKSLVITEGNTGVALFYVTYRDNKVMEIPSAFYKTIENDVKDICAIRMGSTTWFVPMRNFVFGSPFLTFVKEAKIKHGSVIVFKYVGQCAFEALHFVNGLLDHTSWNINLDLAKAAENMTRFHESLPTGNPESIRSSFGIETFEEILSDLCMIKKLEAAKDFRVKLDFVIADKIWKLQKSSIMLVCGSNRYVIHLHESYLGDGWRGFVRAHNFQGGSTSLC